MSYYFLPHMVKNSHGIVINTVSISGISGEYASAAYSASKAAVLNLTRSMALDYAEDNIRVNAVCPGPTRTPMWVTEAKKGGYEFVENTLSKKIPMHRIAEPEEIANAVLFLASDRSSYITGSSIVIDSGLTAHTGQ